MYGKHEVQKVMPINSRSKGKRGELELSHVIQAKGWGARRGQQYSGGNDSPDIVSELPGNFHIECKRVEAGNLYNWLDQATEDADPKAIPVVMHRRNDKPWVAIMDLENFFILVKLAFERDQSNGN